MLGSEGETMTPCNCPTCQWRRGRQRQTLSRPLPWWKRMTRWDWLFVALCLAGAAVCIGLVVRG